MGAPGAVPGSEEEARGRLGEYFAEVLLMDQSATAAKAIRIKWKPSIPVWSRNSAAAATALDHSGNHSTESMKLPVSEARTIDD